jgi:NADH-quinone oxidoreductase subunit M
MAVLFVIMGVASPYWMRAIDTAGAALANKPNTFESNTVKAVEMESYNATQGGAR